MKPYEMMVILRADVTEDEMKSQLESLERWITGTDGKIENIEHWGRRRMAYEIKDQRDGYYLVYTLSLPSQAPAEIERNLRITENVLRYLVTRIEA